MTKRIYIYTGTAARPDGPKATAIMVAAVSLKAASQLAMNRLRDELPADRYTLVLKEVR